MVCMLEGNGPHSIAFHKTRETALLSLTARKQIPTLCLRLSIDLFYFIAHMHTTFLCILSSIYTCVLDDSFFPLISNIENK